jgi:hypothetical protein
MLGPGKALLVKVENRANQGARRTQPKKMPRRPSFAMMERHAWKLDL